MADSTTTNEMRKNMVKMLRLRVTTALLFGLFYALAPSAEPQTAPKKPAATAPAPAEEQVSPEEKKKRKDWGDQMLRKPAPKKGCFDAAYPSTEWKEVPCVKAPNIPGIPRRGPRPAVVGNAND